MVDELGLVSSPPARLVPFEAEFACNAADTLDEVLGGCIERDNRETQMPMRLSQPICIRQSDGCRLLARKGISGGERTGDIAAVAMDADEHTFAHGCRPCRHGEQGPRIFEPPRPAHARKGLDGGTQRAQINRPVIQSGWWTGPVPVVAGEEFAVGFDDSSSLEEASGVVGGRRELLADLQPRIHE